MALTALDLNEQSGSGMDLRAVVVGGGALLLGRDGNGAGARARARGRGSRRSGA